MAVFEACLVFNVTTHQIKTLSNVNADSKSFYIVLYFPNDGFLIYFCTDFCKEVFIQTYNIAGG